MVVALAEVVEVGQAAALLVEVVWNAVVEAAAAAVALVAVTILMVEEVVLAAEAAWSAVEVVVADLEAGFHPTIPPAVCVAKAELHDKTQRWGPMAEKAAAKTAAWEHGRVWALAAQEDRRVVSAFVPVWVREQPGGRTATPVLDRAQVERLPGRQSSIAMNPMPQARKVPPREQLFRIATPPMQPVLKERLPEPP